MAPILIALILIGLSALAWWKKIQIKGTRQFLQPDAPRDTVILHQFGPAPCVPSISPFVIKMETFLRVTKIPYENRFDKRMGPKGKIPWFQLNEDILADSQHCIEFLNKKFSVDLNKRLSAKDLAVGHVVRRTLDEWMYWMLVLWRLVFEPNATLYRILGIPRVFVWYMKRVASSRVLSQGIGLHSQEEVREMMKQDLKALDVLLGDNKFLFGNQVSDVTEFDCALFGQLCQLVWQTPETDVKEIIQEQFPKLLNYCQSMKEAFWPDWDERLQKPTNYRLASKSTAPTMSTSTTTATADTKKSDENGRFQCNRIIASNLTKNVSNNTNSNINSNNNNSKSSRDE